MAKLIPADRTRCQAEVLVYNAFILGGAVRASTRCSNKPTVIAKETKPGPDGLKGSMSLCDACRLKLVEQFTKAKKQLPRFTKLPKGRT